MTNEQLYEGIRDAVQPLLSGAERMFASLSDATCKEADFRDSLSKLLDPVTTLRRAATDYLTSDAVTGVDDQMVYEAKRHIHTDIGRVCTMSHLYLQEDEPSVLRADLVSEWQDVFRSLKTGVWKKEDTDVKKQITDAADAAGIRVRFETALPQEEAELRAYIKNAAAKILAAVRAGQMSVTI